MQFQPTFSRSFSLFSFGGLISSLACGAYRLVGSSPGVTHSRVTPEAATARPLARIVPTLNRTVPGLNLWAGSLSTVPAYVRRIADHAAEFGRPYPFPSSSAPALCRSLSTVVRRTSGRRYLEDLTARGPDRPTARPPAGPWALPLARGSCWLVARES